jgi:hypothetical protein
MESLSSTNEEAGLAIASLSRFHFFLALRETASSDYAGATFQELPNHLYEIQPEPSDAAASTYSSISIQITFIEQMHQAAIFLV